MSGSRVKKIARKMRIPRSIFYQFQHMKEWNQLPIQIKGQSKDIFAKIAGKYQGERCFIIGNGPSLQVSDLERLKDEYCFATNRIFTIYANTSWRPTFYAAQDGEVIDNMKKDLPGTIAESFYSFISAKQYHKYPEAFCSSKNVAMIPMRYKPPKKNLYGFSKDASKEVFEGLTITYTCIQLAVYMGFSEIYLLGVDHNYSIEIDDDGNIIKQNTGEKNYFAEAEVPIDSINLPKVVEMTRAYLTAEKYCKAHGIHIYNATRGGKLEAFERVDFDSIIVTEKDKGQDNAQD